MGTRDGMASGVPSTLSSPSIFTLAAFTLWVLAVAYIRYISIYLVDICCFSFALRFRLFRVLNGTGLCKCDIV